MANHEGTRWRGQLPIPTNAHPLVRQLIALANDHQTTIREIGDRAGVSPKTVSDWRYRSAPNLVNFEAALNALGYELLIRERRGEP